MKRMITLLISAVIITVGIFVAIDISSSKESPILTGENETIVNENLSTTNDPSYQTDEKKDTVSNTTQQTDEKTVYLTFDDGPSSITPDILDVLDKYQAKATFFVTGLHPEYKSYIKIAHEKGHTIGLHTFSHNYSEVYSSIDAYYSDLNKIGELVKEQIGYVPRYIRFPGGSSNTVSKNYTPGIMTTLTQDVTEKGYLYFDWNSDTQDASGSLPVEALVSHAKESLGIKHIVMLAHDASGKETTLKALPEIIEFYQSHGYTFKGLDDTSNEAHHRVSN